MTVPFMAAAALVAPQAYARLTSVTSAHPVDSDRFVPASAALVLGARVWQDGRPSLFLQQRVEAGVRLWQRRLVSTVILSGAGHNREGLDETAAMKRSALALGMPAGALIVDQHGHDTRASAVNARTMLTDPRVIVCTQEFHLPRALWLCRSAGLTVQGAFPPILMRSHTAFGYARELPATWKAAAEILRDRRS